VLGADLLLGIWLEEGPDEVSTLDGLRSLCRLFTAPLKKKRGGHPRPGAAVQLQRSIHPGAWTAQTPSSDGLPDGRRKALRDVVVEDPDELRHETVATQRAIETAI